MAIRTKPQAAVVHVRSAALRARVPFVPLSTGPPRGGRADLAVFHNTRRSSGGGSSSVRWYELKRWG
jgi:hypothetical protein